MADRILISRGTAPVKLATGKSVKVPATKDQAYQVIDLAAPPGNAPADPAKLAKEGGDLVVRYPDGTQFTLGDFFTVCPGNACTVTLADGTATGQIVNAGAIAAADAGGLGFWGWTAIIGGGLGLAAAGGGGGGGSAPVDPGPSLTGSTPTNNDVGVNAGDDLVLTFDENVVAGTGNIVISNGVDTRSIPVTSAQVTISGSTVTINPTAPLQNNSHYNVQMAAGVLKGADGVAFAGISDPAKLDFYTEDLTAPTLQSSTPADNATAVLVGSNIVLTFNKSIRAGTGDIIISNGAGDTRTISVNDATQVNFSGNTVTINPTATLLGNSHYNVQMAAGVLRDFVGNDFAGILDNATLDFDTQDLAPPTLSGSTPADNATAVLIGADIVLTFNEPVVAGSGNIVISNGTDTRTISITDGSRVSIAANTVTINPGNDLQSNSHYHVLIGSGVIRDAVGNAFAAITDTSVLDFETQDTAPPSMVGSTPADNATAVVSGANIVLSFNESVQAGSGNIVISNGAGDTRSISVTDASQVSISGNTVTINPATDLLSLTHYSVTFGSGVIRDVVGNAFAGISSGTLLDFTTRQDTQAPGLVSSSPVANATAVLAGSNVVLTFSENVLAGTGNIVISSGADSRTISIADSSQVTISGNTVTINLATDLRKNSRYTLEMQSGVLQDAVGNLFGGIASGSLAFDTETDFVAPTLTGSTPSDNATGVLVGGNIVLTFSEAVMAGAGNIVISNGTDTRTISVTDATQVNISGNTVTINPLANLLSNSHYSVEMAAGVFRDVSGNDHLGILIPTALDFDTQDLLGPTLSSSTPADNSAGVMISSDIVLTFNEAVIAGLGDIVISNGAGDTRMIGVASGQVSFNGNMVTINPTDNLLGNSTYSVEMNSGVIRDAFGNSFSGISGGTVLNFSTQDLAGPLLVNSSPADNATEVLRSSNLVLTFSEPVRAGVGTLVISNGAGDTRIIDVTDPTQVSISGSTVTINPLADLQSNSHYNVQMAAGVIQDVFGNDFAGIASPTVLDFETQDLIGPVLVSSSPASGEAVVLPSANIQLSFDEAITVGSGRIVISNGSDTRTIFANDNTQVTVVGNVVNINPVDLLQANSRYSVQVDAGAFRDAFGNDFQGISDSTSLTFDTTNIDLSVVASGFGGFVINGQSANDQLGYSVSNAGDVNGDGLMDLIVAAPYGDPSLRTDAGRSYVVFGKTDNGAVELSALVASGAGLVIGGNLSGDRSGYSVSAAGDVNGDGLADLIVGAPYADPNGLTNEGSTFVVFGKTAAEGIELSAVAAGNGGFVINGASQGTNNAAARSYSGRSVSAAGDVNGDGLADLIIGAPETADSPVGGRAFVVFGRTATTAVELSAVSTGVGGFYVYGSGSSSETGFSVSGAGDVNGDGLADVIVGAASFDTEVTSTGNFPPEYSGNNVGRSYVVFGKTSTASIRLDSVAYAAGGGFTITGEGNNDYAGYSVSAAGDVNGDGRADLLVGAWIPGRAYVVFGQTGGLFDVQLSDVAAGVGGYVLDPPPGFVTSVSSAGDVNGDGLTDFVVGAGEADGGGTNIGSSYLLLGKTSASVAQQSFRIIGQSAGDMSSQSVSAAGDVNGDGLADLIVGAPGNNPGSGAAAGRAYVIFGSTEGAFANTEVDQFGGSADDVFADDGVSQTMVTGQGDDTLTATAASVLYGGAGDDLFVIGDAMLWALRSPKGFNGNLDLLARIDGGTGIDTLALSGTNLTLDLTQIANQAASNPDGGSRIDSIERIDLTGTGNNTLVLQLRDVLDMGSANTFVTTGRQQLLVTGNANDTLDFADAAGTTNWTQSGTASIDSVTYNIWNHNTALATVYVNTALTVI